MRTIKWEGLIYKAVPEMSVYDDEWDMAVGACSGCAFVDLPDCNQIREQMEKDCADDTASGTEGEIYVPIEIQDIPLLNQGEENE